MTASIQPVNRKPYQKPVVLKVDLVIEEASLGNTCKTGSVGGISGPNSDDCNESPFTPCKDFAAS